MRNNITAAIGVLLSLLTAAPSFAHPGHDHSAPTADWPVHPPQDRTAGLGLLVNPNATAVNAPLADDETPAVAATLDSALNHRLRSWMFANGTTGTSDNLNNVNGNRDVDAVVSSILANVNTVAFDNDWSYIRTTGIPSHTVDASNPNIPGDIDATYRVRLSPTEELGTKVTSYNKFGPIGVLANGVAIYSPSDATYWNGGTGTTNPGSGTGPPANTDWFTNALWRRAGGMDAAGGHASPFQGQTNPNGSNKGLYHYHKYPSGFASDIDPGNNGTMGSPVFGYAFDGYAIVGPYAYEDDGNGNLNAIQMTSSYKVKDASSRPANGPSVADLAMGSFLEDFEYDADSGNLNEYNMAFVKFDGDNRAILTDVTDIEGEWAYFMTLDVAGGSPNDTNRDFEVAYPYIVGPEFFGEVDDALIRLAPGPMPALTVPNSVSYLFEYLPGDYNLNGVVDAADYTVWRDYQGTPAGTLLNDVDGGVIGMAQYDTWKNNFGNVAPTLLAAAAVPEPRALAMIGCCFAALFIVRLRRKQAGPSRHRTAS